MAGDREPSDPGNGRPDPARIRGSASPVSGRWPRARTALRSFGIYRAVRRRQVRPLVVSWFLTGRCNLRCRGCFYYAHGERSGPDLPADRCREVLRELGELGVPFLDLVGGEPLLRSDTLNLADYARRLGLSVHLTTNGLALRPGDGRKLDRVFETIFVSVDGFQRENDAVRGEGAWVRAMAGLDICREECERALVGVATVMNEMNFASLGAWSSWLQQRGVARLALLHGFAPWGTPALETAKDVLSEVKRLKALHPAFLVEDASHFDRLLEVYSGARRRDCHADRLLHVALFHDGEVSACCKYPVPLGHLKEHSLTEVLERAGQSRGSWMRALAACPGCLRQDYPMIVDLFERSPPSLAWALARRLLRGQLPL